ncbi:related to PEX3 - peroxisomal assembly protein -peroxin [Cephalotrichum gorgonifer]|uniref:Related to PEX3 - peroxisomal assembly protein -peroxin n=1 Tax=Cephalotrichum gorgonifer TaxID=2041049 RepID=A0AAE8MY05_9PEZI|nr:related to PEX3 - peroxisomal assembly protein -peroxin [Cephalotrichum gorgonifer]
MFAATRRWFRRNRTPLAVGVGVVGAGYVFTQYVLSRINDARERMSSDRIAKENLRRRFEQNQEDCTFTVLALLPTATANVLEAMDTERITYEIQTMKPAKATGAPPSIAETNITDEDGKSHVSMQSDSGVHASQVTLPPAAAAGDAPQDGGAQTKQSQGPKKTKRQLWDDLAISSTSRAFTLIYTLGLLTMLTRVQLNLLGRKSYLSSVVSLATGSAQATISLEDNDEIRPDQVYGSDFDMNRKYLTFSWWLLNRGWADLMHRVEAAVREVFGHLSPRDALTFDAFSELTLQVRKIVEGATPEERQKSRWLGNLLPPRDMEEYVIRESGVMGGDEDASATAIPPPLRRLLDETADLVESPSFSHVLTLLLDAGFSFLVDQKLAAGAFDQNALTSSADTTTGASGTSEGGGGAPMKAVLLPKILSVLTRQAHVIGNGMPNEYLREMEQVADLEAFAAVVYSSNWESEISDEGLVVDAGGVRLGDAEEQAQKGEQGRELPPAGAEVGESVVIVEPEASLESAWEKAMAGK